MRLNLPNYLRLRRSPVISEFYFLSRRNISKKLSVEFAPGRIIRWRKRRFVVVDCTGSRRSSRGKLGSADSNVFPCDTTWYQSLAGGGTGRPFCQTEAVEMNGRRPTPIFATNFVSEERDLALRGFVSSLGSRARQTSMSGSLGTLALYATPPIHRFAQSWASSGKASMA